MAISCKTESKLLSHDELQTVRATHHPEIYDADLKELRAVQQRLRSERSKLRTLINRARRIGKGRPEAREVARPPNGEHLARRKQVFAKALRRVNNEIKRLRKAHAGAMLAEAAHRALAARRSNFAVAPSGGQTPSAGMQPNPGVRRRRTVPRSMIGSVSQATKVAQAVRDAKRAAAAH